MHKLTWAHKAQSKTKQPPQKLEDTLTFVLMMEVTADGRKSNNSTQASHFQIYQLTKKKRGGVKEK